jgi:hypothetical protein
LALSSKPRIVTDKQTGTATAPEGSGREQAAADACAHGNPMWIRLIDYTRYGAWIGCVQCGTSWLIRRPG